MASRKTIAIFDFDGTITTKDTLFDFIRFYAGIRKFILGLIITSPVIILFKLGFRTNEQAKQRLFSYFFKGVEKADFDIVCKAYADRIEQILNREAIEKLRYHQAQGHTVIINSASVCNWISPWAKLYDIEVVIGTRIEDKEGKITGRFSGKNCFGQEKVNRFLELYPDRQSYDLYAYGDSNGDKEILAIADYPFYKKFN